MDTINVTETGSLVFDTSSRINVSIHLSDIVLSLSSDLKLDKTLTKYLVKRTRFEGIKFLCLILPKFAGVVLRSLELEGFKSLHKNKITDFIRTGRRSPFRVLLSGLYHEDGIPKVDESAKYSLYCILQLCEFFKKLELPTETQNCYNAANSFVEKNAELEKKQDPESGEIMLARHIIQRVFPMDYKSAEHFYHHGSISDGPGTYSRELPERNGDKTLSCSVLKRGKRNNVFPVHAKKYKKFIKDSYPEGATFADIPRSYSELLLVPKTVDKVRAIVREPKHNLRMQAPFFDEQSRYLRSISGGRLNVYSQTLNQERARKGSLTRTEVTADVENGSNSVSLRDICSYEHFSAPFRCLVDDWRTDQVFVPINWEESRDRAPVTYLKSILIRKFGSRWIQISPCDLEHELLSYVQFDSSGALTGPYKHFGSSKSLKRTIEKLLSHCQLVCKLVSAGGVKTVYGNRLGYVIDLHMLAGMGSYLTFCSMMRYLMVVLILSAIRDRIGFTTALRKGNRKRLNLLIDSVFTSTSIYGDDMEYLTEFHDAFLNWAPSKGVKINTSKTFVNSHFRESCGPYYYFGTDVTPTRCKLSAEDQGSTILIKNENTNLAALSDFVRLLDEAGLRQTSRVFKKAVRRSLDNRVCRGILSTSNTGVGHHVIWQPTREPYFGMTDEDRLLIYWSEDHRKPTVLGSELELSSSNLGAVSRYFLEESWKLCPALYTYEPMALPAIKRKGNFVFKADTYGVLEETTECELWALICLLYASIILACGCSIVAGVCGSLL